MCKWGQPTPSNSSQAGPEQTNLPNQLRELWEILNGCCFRLLSLGMTYSEKISWHRSLGHKDGAHSHGNGLVLLWIHGSCPQAPNPNPSTGLFPLVKALLKVYLAFTMFQTEDQWLCSYNWNTLFILKKKWESQRKPFFTSHILKNYWIQNWQDYRICLTSPTSGFMRTLMHACTHIHTHTLHSITAFSQLITVSERSRQVLGVTSKSTNDDYSVKVTVSEYSVPSHRD